MPVNVRRPSVSARRFGYILAATITAAMFYIINVWPGWHEVPFLTDDTGQVLWLVNASLVASIAANVVYAAYDPPWLKSLGDLVTTGIGLAVLVRVWQVFPFDFSSYSVNWGVLARFLLVVAIVGSIIGITVQVVSLIRLAIDGGAGAGRRGEVRQ
jgi:hypothetical protein